MRTAEGPETIHFSRDMTLRWPCRRGDFILWMGYSDIFSGSESIEIRDLWEMRDGYHVTITNRPEDFPAWFELHPTEVCDVLVYKMMARIQQGYTPPGECIDGPNLWRLKSGDRLAWVGCARHGRIAENGILGVLAFDECALVVGEGNLDSTEDLVGFGAPTSTDMKPEDAARCRAAVSVVKRLGLPRTWTPDWRLG